MSTTPKTRKDALSLIPELPPDSPIYRRVYVIGQTFYRPARLRPAPGKPAPGKPSGDRDE